MGRERTPEGEIIHGSFIKHVVDLKEMETWELELDTRIQILNYT